MRTPIEIEIHVTLYGNHVDYVLPLAKNLAWSKKNRAHWKWLLHVDDSVPSLTRESLLALGSSANKLVDHTESRLFGMLWRYEVAIRGEFKRDRTVAVLDADQNLEPEIVRILDTFASTGRYGMLLHKPTYSYTTFIPRIQADFAVFRFPVNTSIRIPELNKKKELMKEYIQNTAGTPEIVYKGLEYGFDELFLTRFALPVWEKLVPIKWIAEKDLWVINTKAHPTRYILRKLGISRLSFSGVNESQPDPELVRAKQVLSTQYRYRSEVARRFTIRHRPDFCYERITI